MKKVKVYLAKSNRANPNLVSKVRQTLSNFNIEVVEYTGGTYSHQKILECDHLVVVPEDTHGDEERSIVVGKGLYEQITLFSINKSTDDVLLVIDEELQLGEISEIEIVDENDYIEHGEIYFTAHSQYLDDTLNEILADYFSDDVHPIELIKKAINKNKNKNNYFYLLTK